MQLRFSYYADLNEVRDLCSKNIIDYIMNEQHTLTINNRNL